MANVPAEGQDAERGRDARLDPAALWLPVRRFLRRQEWRPQFRRLERLGKIGDGRRAFLVGSGPSLAAMDLSKLDGEFVCLANMAIRALGDRLAHADMHVMNDAHGYRRYAEEIETTLLRHLVKYRFLNTRSRRTWRHLGKKAGDEPIYIVPHTTKLLALGRVPSVAEGVANGPTVLISAAILLRHLGFDPIYILGCDLEYDSGARHFYPITATDVRHEKDPEVAARRRGMASADAYFAVLRTDFGRRGNQIINAGVGGKLTSLERVPFEDLFR